MKYSFGLKWRMFTFLCFLFTSHRDKYSIWTMERFFTLINKKMLSFLNWYHFFSYGNSWDNCFTLLWAPIQFFYHIFSSLGPKIYQYSLKYSTQASRISNFHFVGSLLWPTWIAVIAKNCHGLVGIIALQWIKKHWLEL